MKSHDHPVMTSSSSSHFYGDRLHDNDKDMPVNVEDYEQSYRAIVDKHKGAKKKSWWK